MKISQAFSTLEENKHYTFTMPEKVSSPKILCWSESLAKELGLGESSKFLNILSGNEIFKESKPIATRYGGHQFGQWAGQLGDGRAIILGEIENQNKKFELQIKGAGQSVYSRRGDGKAVLRSSLREYLCSEAMHYLGVPTTRALSLVTTGDTIIRDMFYDGNPEPEPGAICSRVAPSFLRFGHYQIFASTGETKQLQEIVNFTLNNYFPNKSIEEWFEEVTRRTAFLITEWYRVGFVHGVMNTDNMSILGLTIDYGPYGWIDSFDLNWTPNTTDFEYRRYSFGAQANIAFWNLSRLAEALSVLGHNFEKNLQNFSTYFNSYYQKMMANKLGLKNFSENLNTEVISLLQEQEIDMTLFYRGLAEHLTGNNDIINEAFYQPITKSTEEKLNLFLKNWKNTIERDGESVTNIKGKMNRTNPIFTLRNYLTQIAIDELKQGNETQLRNLEIALQTPYDLNANTSPFFAKRPDWARNRAGCSTLSCSS